MWTLSHTLALAWSAVEESMQALCCFCKRYREGSGPLSDHADPEDCESKLSRV